MLLNMPRTAGILTVTTLLCPALRLTAGQPFLSVLIRSLCGNCYSSKKVRMSGLLPYVAVYQWWSLWLRKLLPTVSESGGPAEEEGEEPMSLEGFSMQCLWPCLLGSLGYNSISFSSCGNPVPAHISNTISS